MSKGSRSLKLQAARSRKRAAKYAQYERRTDSLPSETTNYGKRWHARRRNEPMASRTHESRPWYYPLEFAQAPGRKTERRPIRSGARP
jgi:hypothetical protein